ncbi:palmitoyltransferase PFA4 [Coprinopsis cinerea AmutBmut pab1-1]|nr:palmitoyltransferase PFA4 [Coprinopsis cinerea AmutBmut pab1-1]
MSLILRIIEGFVQLFVLALSLLGWYVAVYHVGVGWLVQLQERRLLGGLYILVTGTLIPACIFLYLYLCSGRTTHNVFDYPAPDVSALTEPYPCATLRGELATCNRARCKSKWKPPRSHHCSTCNVCRLEFDHHCPWLGNCVTIQRQKAFLLLLLLFPVVFFVGVAPVAQTLMGHVDSALLVSYMDPFLQKYWWDRPYSWVILAGPFGRYIVGIVLGYAKLNGERRGEVRAYAGQWIEEPFLRVVFACALLLLLATFSLGLAVMTLRSILQGTTSYEDLKRSGRVRKGYTAEHVCIPEVGPSERDPLVVPVPPKRRLYDLGRAQNWRLFWRSQFFPTVSPVYTWPKLNPDVLREAREQANINANSRAE